MTESLIGPQMLYRRTDEGLNGKKSKQMDESFVSEWMKN